MLANRFRDGGLNIFLLLSVILVLGIHEQGNRKTRNGAEQTDYQLAKTSGDDAKANDAERAYPDS